MKDSSVNRILSDNVWKSRIELLWIVLAVLYTIAADYEGLFGRSQKETSTTLLLISGVLVSAMLLHILNRREQNTPRDLLLWAFTASTVCATSALKLGDHTGTTLTSAYAVVFAICIWNARRRSVPLLRLLLRCLLCATSAGVLGFVLTGIVHGLDFHRQPFVTIFPVSSAAFSALLFGLITSSSSTRPWAISGAGAIVFTIAGYFLLPEQLKRAWGLSESQFIGALIGLSVALFVAIPMSVLFRTFFKPWPSMRSAGILLAAASLGGGLHGVAVSLINTMAVTQASTGRFILFEATAAFVTAIGVLIALGIERKLTSSIMSN